MKVLVTGKGGQLAWELEQTKPAGVELLSLGIDELDITNSDAVQAAVAQFRPDVVINAAAYTAVDKAETDQELAYAVNESGARNLAEACKNSGARLLHVSTDFVFDGTQTTPYQANSRPNPINVYGASKLAGDLAVQQLLPDASVIVRTAWVYSANGNNFVKTMLRLMAEKPELGVIYDQVGTPTWAKGLAQWLWVMSGKLLESPLRQAQGERQAVSDKRRDTRYEQQAASEELQEKSSLRQAKGERVAGVYHWTDAGVASWYDFAVAIQELGIEKGLLSNAVPVRAIPTSAYPTPAKRPAFSVIDKSSAEAASGLKTVHWRKQLSAMMDELKSRG